MCSIDTVFGLVEKLLKSSKMEFLLMYKFSQDHLELFFNAVRRCGMYSHPCSVFISKLEIYVRIGAWSWLFSST